ncbi:glycosyltransferase [Mesorhizobium sp. 8]|uniref:glycosyltransferase n=1 Tax=Mesorhizobium sp. 8 TaxID=2584466 RepID=UPI0011222C90|nr:glycosyltransferase [Mesorhizobium sp. 8]QDC02938.1 glycosyltransferase family 4 protein [Mesorhizobium sp. 8]
MKRSIAWVAGHFDQVGGGERLIQEGIRFYRNEGHRTVVFTWSYDDAVSFDGRYDPSEVVTISPSGSGKNTKRALARLFDIPKLRRFFKEYNVDTVFVQSEYDVALVYLSTRFLKIDYKFLIFGQNYQFPEDYGKYTFIFRRHLKRIVNSYKGYRDTVSLTPPKIRISDRVAMEMLSVIRYLAVRSAQRLFVFSHQVQWETKLLFGRTPTIARGAFRREDLGEVRDFVSALAAYDLVGTKYVLSVCRMAPKKRLSLVVEAFYRANLADDIVLVLGGDGPERSNLEAQAKGLGIADRVKFLGRVPDEHLPGLKQAAQVFVSMDIGDYDISPLEALIHKTPIVLPTEFDAEGLETTAGVVVCPAEADAVAAVLPGLIGTRSRPSEDLLNSFTWENYFSDLLK